MDENFSLKMPLDFQMALAHNPKAMHAFLSLDNQRQDEIIKRAHSIETKREMALFVSEINQSKI